MVLSTPCRAALWRRKGWARSSAARSSRSGSTTGLVMGARSDGFVRPNTPTPTLPRQGGGGREGNLPRRGGGVGWGVAEALARSALEANPDACRLPADLPPCLVASL